MMSSGRRPKRAAAEPGATALTQTPRTRPNAGWSLGTSMTVAPANSDTAAGSAARAAGAPLVRVGRDRRADRAPLVVAHQGHVDRFAGAHETDFVAQVGRAVDRLVVDRHDDVAGLDAGLLGWRAGLGLRDEGAAVR